MKEALNHVRFRAKPCAQWDEETLSYILPLNTQRLKRIFTFQSFIEWCWGEVSLLSHE
jgi:hypothetical protein